MQIPNLMITEIIITPVSNGWTVSIPSLHFNDGEYDPTGGMMKFMPGIIKQITDPDSVETEQEVKKEKPQMARNNSVFVFSSIEEVLAFLAKQITDK